MKNDKECYLIQGNPGAMNIIDACIKNKTINCMEQIKQHLGYCSECRGFFSSKLLTSVREYCGEENAITWAANLVGCDYQTISSMLNIPQGTVKSRICNVRKNYILKIYSKLGFSQDRYTYLHKKVVK